MYAMDDLSKDIPKSIYLEAKYRIYTQTFEYENNSIKYNICNIYCHQNIHYMNKKVT